MYIAFLGLDINFDYITIQMQVFILSERHLLLLKVDTSLGLLKSARQSMWLTTSRIGV